MIGSFFRRLTKRVFIMMTIFICLLFLSIQLNTYLSPNSLWLLSFISLLLPYLIILILLFVIFWLVTKPLLALIPLITLALGWNILGTVFAFNLPDSFEINKTDSSLRIISWNVGNMYGLSEDANIRKHSRTEIAALVKHLSPDIICLQEFNHSQTQGQQADNIGLFTDEYPYYNFSKDYNKRNGYYMAGSIIFSKFPIIRYGKIRYPHPIRESLIYADIVKNNDTLRIFTTHLQSFLFSKSDKNSLDNMTTDKEELDIESSKNIVTKMKHAFQRRAIQAQVVRNALDSCPYRSIITGDFNDVPASYTYMTIKGTRQDAFLEQGFGIGRTYISIAPTLRIDYILPDNDFNVLQYDVADEDLSDHVLIVADLSLKK